jgi:hypothetical protein
MRNPCVSALLTLALAATGQAQQLSPVIPVDVKYNPTDPKASQADFFEFGWQSFIGLNWPSLTGGQRGQPDPKLKIGATGPDGAPLPVVWLGYKDPDQVFLPKGATPPDWNVPPTPPACQMAGNARLFLHSLEKIDLSALNQAGFYRKQSRIKERGALVDQALKYVLYDQRLNRSEYQYTVDNKYYLADNQCKAVGSPGSKDFKTPPKGNESWMSGLPEWARQGAIEIKASWRMMDAVKDKAALARYYHVPAVFVEPHNAGDPAKCQNIEAALVGLHILRLTPNTGTTWYWATFEQVDNVQIEPGPGAPKTPAFNPGPNGTPKPPYPTGFNGKETVITGPPLPVPTAPVNVSRLAPIPPEADTVNQRYRAALKGTVWAYYELVDVMNQAVQNTNSGCLLPGHNRPGVGDLVYLWPPKANAPSCRMANTTIETFVQHQSCMDCHGYYGVPIGPSAKKDYLQFGNLQIFTFFLQHAQFSDNPPAGCK